MIALSCNQIIMDNLSSLGTIDPQVGGMSAHEIIDEVERSYIETQVSPKLKQLWQPIIAKYDQKLVNSCEKAIVESMSTLRKLLIAGMFREDEKAKDTVNKILDDLGDYSLRKSHDRHISLKHAEEMGIKVKELENIDETKELQEIILGLHLIYIQTLTNTPAFKIIENHNGITLIQNIDSYFIH